MELGAGGETAYSCVVVSWGFHADLVKNSDRLRWCMGPSRFTVVGMAQWALYTPSPCDVHFVGTAYRVKCVGAGLVIYT